MHLIIQVLIISSLESVLANQKEQNTQEGHLEKIREWWNIVSEQKPIKCNKIELESKITNGDLFDHFKGPPGLQSLKCGVNESGQPYKIRGNGLKVIDGILQGTGKLIFLSKKSISQEVSNETCIKPILFSITKVSEVVGTFVDGLLEGPSKVKYANGATSIGSFKNGYPHGFWRFWNKDNHLEKVTSLFKGKEADYCWTVEYGLLIFTYCSPYGRENHNHALVMDLDQDSDFIYIGQKSRSTNLIDSLYTPKITYVSSINDCILEVRHEPEEKLNKKLLFNKGSRKLIDDEFNHKTSLCSKIINNSSLTSNTMELRSFFKEVEEIAYDSGHSIYEFAPAQESLDKQKALILLPEIRLGANFSTSIEISVLNGPITTYEIIDGDYDSEFRCHGLCTLKLADEFIARTDLGSDPTLGWKPIVIRGDFKRGLLNGPCTLQLQDGRIPFGFAVDGVLHGPLLIYGVLPILPPRKNPLSFKHYSGLGFLGNYVNGRASGQYWIGMIGGGFLHGIPEKTNATVTGNDIAYIYDDLETVLYGKFENRIMLSGRESTVEKVKCLDNGIMIVTEFAKPSGPEFYYEPPSNKSFGSGPPGVTDPFERKWVELRESTVPFGGQGVFLKKDIDIYRIVALFSGYFFDHPEEIQYYDEACIQNTSLSDDHRRSCKKYTVGLPSYKTLIDYPPELDNPGTFHPTMAQKINHDFLKNNTLFHELEHPRWGAIMSALTSKPIKAGEELFGYYGYEVSDFPYDFPWYFEEKRKIDKLMRLSSKKEKDIKNPKQKKKPKK